MILMNLIILMFTRVKTSSKYRKCRISSLPVSRLLHIQGTYCNGNQMSEKDCSADTELPPHKYSCCMLT